MVWRLSLSRHNVSSSDPERVDEPEDKQDDLNAADDGKAAEESHGASNEAQLGHSLDLLVSLDVVKGCCVKVDLHQLKGRFNKLFPLKKR